VALTRIVSEIIQDNTIENRDISGSFTAGISGSWRGELSSSNMTDVGGGVSGSVTSTGSFGRVEAAGVVFADSFKSVTGGATIDFNDNVNLTGNLTATGNISSSFTSTGSFGRVQTTNIDIDSISGNWTNAGNTVADLGTVTTVDINGGTIDGITSLTAGGNLDIGAHGFRASTLTADSQTSGRVAIYSTAGLLSEDSDLTFTGATLSATNVTTTGTIKDFASVSGSYVSTGSVGRLETQQTNASLGGSIINLAGNLTTAGTLTTQNNNVTINAAGAARTLTLNESLTIGDGHDGTITFGAASKTLTIENTSLLNQDLTTDASPTFAGATITGTLTVQEIHTEFESASILFTSGSTQFGNSTDDVHNVTGSMKITGSFQVDNGTLTAGTVDINGGTIDGITSLTAGGDLDIGAHDLRAATITADSLTATRVPFAGTAGVLSDDSDLTFATATLSATNLTTTGTIKNMALVSGSITSTGSFGSVVASGTGINTFTGKMGIGTTVMDAFVNINSGAANAGLHVESTDSSANISLADNAGSAAVINIGGRLVFETGGTASTAASSGTESMTISGSLGGSGKVGIGTSNPTGLIHVDAGSAWNTSEVFPFHFVNLDGNAVDAYGMLVRAGGNDHNTPIFEIQDYGGNTDFRITGRGEVVIGKSVADTTAEAVDLLNVIGDTGDVRIRIRAFNQLPMVDIQSASGSIAVPQPPGKDQELGRLNFTSFDGSDYSQSPAKIIIRAPQDHSDNDAPADMEFFVNSGDRLGYQVMNISGSGKLGYGRNTNGHPNMAFHFSGSGIASNGQVGGMQIETETYGQPVLRVLGKSSQANDAFGLDVQAGDGTAWIARFAEHDGSERMRINGNGNVGIGETAPDERLHVKGGGGVTIEVESTAANDARFMLKTSSTQYTIGANEGGRGNDTLSIDDDQANQERLRIKSDGEIDGNFNDTSDRAQKENIKDLTNTLEGVKALNPSTFNWIKEKAKGDKTKIGFIAQDVEKQFPELVDGKEGEKSISTIGLVSVLTKTVQELIKRIEELEN
jgi:hypothetical protein